VFAGIAADETKTMSPQPTRISEKKLVNSSSQREIDGWRSLRPVGAEGGPYLFCSLEQTLGFGTRDALKALVVDHDDAERSIIAATLKTCGVEVPLAGDSFQALAEMRRTHIDMIFIELRAAGINSHELIAVAKGKSPETEIYVVTSHEKMGDAVECVKRGAEGFVVRPEIAGQVAVAVAKARDRRNLRLLAYTDGLTSLFNRNTFQYFLIQECRRSMRHGYCFALLIMDVDNFKQYNDLNGHLIGDIALIKLGRLLRQGTRASDIPARYGGDEFAVILTQITHSEALFRAKRIRQLVSLSPFQKEKNIRGEKLTVSIGLAFYPKHGTSHLEIIQNADKALYRAKAEGRNRVCVF
jgi:diguanylate cyclase (GGDEF)-like protein